MEAALNTALGALLGFAAAVFSEPLRKWLFRPKLQLEFGSGDSFKTATEEVAEEEVNGAKVKSVHDAYYVRIKVTNIRPAIAKGCRAYLVLIEKTDKEGRFVDTNYCDSIPLPWSCQGDKAFGSLELPKGVYQFIDVVSTRAISDEFRPEIRPIPYRYMKLFHGPGVFKFTILVSGENVKPEFIEVIFKWRGTWNDFEVT